MSKSVTRKVAKICNSWTVGKILLDNNVCFLREIYY